jgi:hypothetical protein
LSLSSACVLLCHSDNHFRHPLCHTCAGLPTFPVLLRLCARSSSPKYGLVADRYHFCEKCFNEIQGNSVTLGDDPAQPQT